VTLRRGGCLSLASVYMIHRICITVYIIVTSILYLIAWAGRAECHCEPRCVAAALLDDVTPRGSVYVVSQVHG